MDPILDPPGALGSWSMARSPKKSESGLPGTVKPISTSGCANSAAGLGLSSRMGGEKGHNNYDQTHAGHKVDCWCKYKAAGLEFVQGWL